MTGDRDTVRATAVTLLGVRAPEATICPSEIARALAARQEADPAADAWRALMPLVHGAVDQMVAEGVLRLSWKGERLAARDGPYRIGRASPLPDDFD